ncbi:sodium:proton antiporter NhaD [Candidatus Protochlamydia phocaeensis]|uniref:sodium:proton antiporter NhaD n=1 Tax=Candidatus Protochlamydia phocaeensis TaxID=1414722 RepID=UPI00083941C1|nr:sodium:proton antiporter NhaD [Candidatus Protochlamydia phocaeensis]
MYDLLMIMTFIIGYIGITIEHVSKINKTSIALLMAIICWALQFTSQAFNHESNLSFLGEHLANISQIIFFLLGALTIVEIINAHKGFRLISDYINITSKRKLLWIVGFLTFFLSCILDNLTTTIIMVTLMSKLIEKGEDRLIMGGAIVIAANAGGAWTPIGDVTTTMLWIGGQLSTLRVILDLFLPSLTCLVVSLFCLSFALKGDFTPPSNKNGKEEIEPMGTVIFWLGVASLIFVPVFKILTGLPPFMGMILGLSIMWIVTDVIHKEYEERYHLRVPHVMTQIDVAGVLFFLGILLSIDALHTAGLLDALATWMNNTISNSHLIAVAIGLASAVVDNVPLVAAVMGMYDLTQYPTDSSFWDLIAYCAGTGGSILVIGSAAGVAFMGLEKVDFFWYFRRIGIPAFIGYLAGIGIFELIKG